MFLWQVFLIFHCSLGTLQHAFPPTRLFCEYLPEKEQLCLTVPVGPQLAEADLICAVVLLLGRLQLFGWTCEGVMPLEIAAQSFFVTQGETFLLKDAFLSWQWLAVSTGSFWSDVMSIVTCCDMLCC